MTFHQEPLIMAYNGEERRRPQRDLNERIAVLEAASEAAADDLKDVKKTVEEIKDELTKYKGMVGGATLVVSCIFTALVFAKDWITSLLMTKP